MKLKIYQKDAEFSILSTDSRINWKGVLLYRFKAICEKTKNRRHLKIITMMRNFLFYRLTQEYKLRRSIMEQVIFSRLFSEPGKTSTIVGRPCFLTIRDSKLGENILTIFYSIDWLKNINWKGILLLWNKLCLVDYFRIPESLNTIVGRPCVLTIRDSKLGENILTTRHGILRAACWWDDCACFHDIRDSKIGEYLLTTKYGIVR